MFNEAAIKELKKDSEVLARQVEGVDFPAALVPNDHSLRSLEEFQKYRNNFRLEFDTSHFQSFVEYVEGALKTQYGRIAPVFFNPVRMSGKVIFDLGDNDEPGHQDHIATIKFDRTAEFSAIVSQDGQRVGQREFVEWLEDWRHLWVAFDAELNPIDNQAKVLAALRNMTVESTSDHNMIAGSHGGSESVTERIEAKSVGVIPGFFKFKFIPHLDFQEREINARLTHGGHRELGLGFRLINAELLKEEIAVEAVEKFKEALPDRQILLGNV
jgi:uncharacterized protein YfdQ (DUF2303 family)